MRGAHQWVESIANVRARLIGARGVQDDVAFQNDVNALLSAVADLEPRTPRVPHGIEAPFGLLPMVAAAPDGSGKTRRSRGALSQLVGLRRVMRDQELPER